MDMHSFYIKRETVYVPFTVAFYVFHEMKPFML